MVEQCRNDPLVGILLDEVAGIRHPHYHRMRERAQPQLVQDCRREGSVLHAPGDADGLVPEMAFEPVLQLLHQERTGTSIPEQLDREREFDLLAPSMGYGVEDEETAEALRVLNGPVQAVQSPVMGYQSCIPKVERLQ